MVSLRCKMLVNAELKKLGLHYVVIDLGEVEILENISHEQRSTLKRELLKLGFELMDDEKAMIIEKIKNTIIEMVHHTNEFPKINFPHYLADQLCCDYAFLADLFSETEGTTIEHFMLMHKIERVKELIIYNELNLTEIARKLQYSSVSVLSNQFKKSTGLTPSFFKSLKRKKKNVLMNV